MATSALTAPNTSEYVGHKTTQSCMLTKVVSPRNHNQPMNPEITKAKLEETKDEEEKITVC